MAAVSSRYARAFADVVAASNLDATKAVEHLRSLVAAFQESHDLREVWESPAIPVEQKHRVLDALCEKLGATERPLRNFIAVLIDQNRIALLPEIAKLLDVELNSRNGRVDAEIVSARELGIEQRSSLVAEISRLTGKAVLPHYSTDDKLIGGVKVRVGSTIYDGSVRGQLQRLRQQLTEN
ncbi:MAG TPA: ATP synthase F1 subunit delta [Candidatus Saccharimonadales bacterium]|nr:ATP synthase F1 subunit delta [Candidatus Saccharimonadales bacterium]